MLKEQNFELENIYLFEIHQAFAATVVTAQRELGIDPQKLNVSGGVIALGHPMGATGAIMAGTLLDELERRNLKTELVAASGAAGSGSALRIERC